MKKRIAALVLITVSVMLMAVGCGIVKIVKIGEEGKYTGEVVFNAGDDVAAIWEESALPELTEKAVNLGEFLTESKGNLTALADKYGRYSMGTSGELSYVVRGTGTVEEVNTESQAGYMVLKPDDYSGGEIIKIQIGPVYRGSSVRDSLSFIKFGDYRNQQDWAAISQSINSLIHEEIVTPVAPETLQGKTVEFVGTFTVETDSLEILITPVMLETK